MRSLKTLRLRFRSLLRSGKVENELNRELQFHLEEQIRENIGAGMNPADARSAALRAIGNIPGLLEECREKRGLRFIEEFGRNLGYAARTLRKNPVFSSVAILTLALGIGANTAIFSLLYSSVLRPVTYTNAGQLILLEHTITRPQGSTNPANWSYPKFESMRKFTSAFEAIAGYGPRAISLTGAGEPERLRGEMVTANYFDVLDIQPLAGRTFVPAEDRPEDLPAVAVISETLWKRKFGSDPAAIGRVIGLNRVSFTIIGVAPASFRGESGAAEIWVPVAMAPQVTNIPNRLRQPMAHWFSSVARLKPGVTPTQANADLKEAVRRMEELRPSGGPVVWSGRAVPLLEAKVDPTIQTSLLVLLAAVGFVLLIACLNLSNLMLSRTIARRVEISIRLTIGAGRGSLMRQFITESLLLAVLGGAAGMIVAMSTIELLALFQPGGVAGSPNGFFRGISFDGTALQEPWIIAFNLVLSIAAGIVFGFLPAIRATRIGTGGANARPAERRYRGLNMAIAEGRTHRFAVRRTLVIGQVGLAVVLLVCAGVMLRSFARLLSVDSGFRPDGVMTLRVEIPGSQYPPEKARRFFQDLTDEIRSLPGVEAASISNTIPLSGQNEVTLLKVDGTEAGQVAVHIVGPDFFKALGIPLIKGRLLNDTDRENSRRVVVVNQTAARQLWPDRDPIGQRLTFGLQDWSEPGEEAEVVGIVGDTKYRLIDSRTDVDVYVSFMQAAPHVDSYVTVKTAIEPDSLIPAIRAGVLSLDPLVPIYAVMPLREVLSRATSGPRFSSLLLGVFAALALIVAGIGVYGMLAYSVAQRTHEIGIRIALGAERSQVARLVIRDGFVLCLIGLALGLAGAYGATRLLRGLLYQVAPADPGTFAAVAILLAVLAPLACYVPARRATRIDPIVALRCE